MLICMLRSQEAIDYFTKNIDNFFDPILNELANFVNESSSLSISSLIALIESMDLSEKKILVDELLSIESSGLEIPLTVSSYEEIGKAIKKARSEYNARRTREKEYQSASSDEERINIALKRSRDIEEKQKKSSQN